MRYTRSGSMLLAGVGGTYVFGSLAATAVVLAIGGSVAFILASRRRQRDRLAVRRQA